ncbi:hypothetical protein QWY75_06390 [Pontixanthobacter aestiaquae]|uniref:Short chain dehydrogenase-like proteobacteria domain-containing protein n=1 Tax=Pontixanthobacter aestiaquae TaxID=1509367 RepID=A0A844Z7E9_9SPHN|nr:hypothetical protein [Pontixanthobacter aestiaquae]MDN3645829.1 hypothetical protein [Pontixanthobacter aestiaquae]MXO83176.1 hypothetical protein [Pontixanthobacter aestiaquae]
MPIKTLPGAALDAAQAIASDWLPAIRDHLSKGEHLVVLLPQASYDHDDWRRAMVRDLARAYAPTRVNFITEGSDEAVEESVEYLSKANGVTGQYLPLHTGARADG